MCMETDDNRRAERQAGPRLNEALVAEVERIARKLHYTVGQEVDYKAMARALQGAGSGLSDRRPSDRRLDGIMIRGQEPEVKTLRMLAEFAGESPLPLYIAAGWLAPHEVKEYATTLVGQEITMEGEPWGFADAMRGVQERLGLSDQEFAEAVRALPALLEAALRTAGAASPRRSHDSGRPADHPAPAG